MTSRPEYPRPEFERAEWINLNGEWDFELDFGCTGRERGLSDTAPLNGKINVPFCPESRLSGVGYRDFINACWYGRTLNIKKRPHVRVLINFEAAYYLTELFVNGVSAGKHNGGYTPFSFDITDIVNDGENRLRVRCEGDARDTSQPSGKQSSEYASHGCYYTRSTGIYQTVWIEYVPENYIVSAVYDTDIDASVLNIDLTLAGAGKKRINVCASYKGKPVGAAEITTSYNTARLSVSLSELHLWDLKHPSLYDLALSCKSGTGEDRVLSYFGMRRVDIDGYILRLNYKPLFQRLVLDQGYYPDGIYTAPTAEALENDIKLSTRLGFNGARLHQRVFERRFLYNADRLGYLVWGEYPSWGIDCSRTDMLKYFLPEWLEAVQRDRNHPALIGWCPFNETWDYKGRRQDDELISSVYRETKRLDPSRPVIDTSGNYHVITDIYDIHDYNQKPETIYDRYGKFEGNDAYERFPDRQRYNGEPFFVSEYGGIRWAADEKGWGYGQAPLSIEEFTTRYRDFAAAILGNPRVCGLCYTQLYDVEQEQNGLYRYDRTQKFDDSVMDELRDAMSAPAAIESARKKGKL